MGASSGSIRYQEIKTLPKDQYICTDCKSIPEILSIDYIKGIIELRCKTHKIKKVNIREYFEKESKNLYYNVRCDECKTRTQKDNLPYIFNHFIDRDKNLCENCTKGKKLNSIKINEMNNYCHNHIKKYIKYCKNCDKHFCSEDNIICGHYIEEIKSPDNKEIDKIKNKIDMLMEYKDIIDNLIKFLNTLLITYKEHPSNYYNSINITNVVKDMNLSNNEYDKEKLLNKIKNLEKNILNEFNTKFEVNLTGEEIKINLNGKNIENLDLKLFCSLDYKYLEEIDLSNNNISNLEEMKNLNSPNLKIINLKNNKIEDIEPLKKMNSSNIKKLDLSHNKIINVKPLEEIMKKNKKMEIINLENNKIKNIEVLKEILKEKMHNISNSIKEIKLKNNNLAKKDIEEIYDILNENNAQFIDIIYRITKKNSDIRLFGEKFIEKNKDKCKILIDNNESELIKVFSCKNVKNNILKVRLKIYSNITDMSGMFNECSSLSSLKGISNWQTGNVTNMSAMFSGCSKLSSLDGISNWKTENVTNMSGMFFRCSKLSSLKGISNWQTGNVTNMSGMFFECSSLSSLEGISIWETGNATNMSGMFSGCSSLSSLEGISNWETGNVTDMSGMFSGCSKLLSLEGISNWKTGNVTDMSGMFKGCSSLSSSEGISNWQTRIATNMREMFSGCSKLSYISRKFLK